MQDVEMITEPVSWEAAEKRVRENYGSRIVLESANIQRERHEINKIREYGLE